MRAPLTCIAAVCVTLAACGGSDGVDELTIEDAWARPTPSGVTTGAVYLTITSPIDDALVAAAVASTVAAGVTLHDTTTEGSHGTGHHEAPHDDMVSMADTERLELPAGQRVAFAPGRLHVMLHDMPGRLELGDQFELSLTLEQAGETAVTVVVSEEEP